MKAIGTIAVFLLAVFLVCATIGAPSFNTDSSGTSFAFGAYNHAGAPPSGSNLFDYWTRAELETTERIRIEQQQATERQRIKEEAATLRNAEFWRLFPLTLIAIAFCIVAVAAGIMAWRWRPTTVPRQITINNYAPLPLREYAAELGIPDAEYAQVDGTWIVIEPYSGMQIAPPSELARLETTRR